MLRLAFRGIASRKLRAATTMLAVFLGVTLMAGSYVLTDTINDSFDQIFASSYEGIDVVVTPKETVEQDEREPPAFSQALLERVRKLPQVEDAAPSVFSNVRILTQKNDPIGSEFAPNFASSRVPEGFETLTYEAGRRPQSPREVALDAAAAERKGLAIGDRVKVAGERSAASYRIVGLVQLGDASFGGAAIAVLTHPEAQRVTGKQGKVDQLLVAGADGVAPEQLKRALSAELPQGVEVRTGEQTAAKESSEIAEDLSFLKIVLLVFSGVSLFVGGFLIFNTFSITVAQRVREFGLLRTLGASRGQVLRAVIAEALLLGIGGALLGVAAGVGFAGAINSLFKSFGIDLPNTGTVLAPRTVIVSLLVGALVTLAAGVVPALRATRVSPIAALRDAELPGSTGARRRLTAALAALLMLAGVAITCIGLFGGIESSGQAASLIGGGAVAAIFGVALFSPRLVRPLASAIGRPIEGLRGLTGRLARENTMRRPGRTAVTAAALMIGLGLVSFVTIFAAGVKGSVDDAIDNNLAGDISIQNTDGFSPIAEDVGPEVTRVPGVGTVSTLATANARVAGVSGDARVSAVEPRTAGEVLKLDFVDGSGDDLASLGRREAIVDRTYVESHGIGVGDKLRVTTPAGKRVEYDVVAEVRDNADFLGDFILTQQAFREDFGESKPFTAFVKLEPGADAGAVQGRIERVVDRRFPAAEVLSQDQLKDSQSEQVNQLLGLIYALLSLAVVVSVFGIVNTLVLSIHERTRELGMLRAIGMSRRQVRRVIRYEAVITSLIGAVLGMALGVLFAALISSPLADEGFSLSFPIANLAILLVLAILAGILAAILPARRAARLDVLRAVAYE